MGTGYSKPILLAAHGFSMPRCESAAGYSEGAPGYFKKSRATEETRALRRGMSLGWNTDLQEGV